VPPRTRNELARDYLGTVELAVLTGYSLTGLKILAANPTGWLPAARLIIGTIAIFDRSEVEEAIAAHGRKHARRGRPSG
jgi:hypothetical protein